MAIATDQERLVVALEARIRDFERNMQRASRTAGNQFGNIEKRAKQSGDRIEKSMSSASARVAGLFENFGAGLAGGIVGGLSVAGLNQLVGSIGKVAEGVANIGSAAKRAGIDVKSFQELSHVAEQNRISVDALTDGMKELQLRADEFIVTGKGSGADAFQRLGFSATELKKRLKDPSALLVEIIGRLEQLDRAAQIRIADELFGGTAGERFVELLDRGAAGIRAQIKEANDLGLVLDERVIKRADEIDRKYKLIARTIETEVKSAVVGVAGEMFDWWESLKGIEEQSSRALGDRLAEIGQQRLDIENQILALREQQDTAILSPYDRVVVGDEIKRLEKESADLHATEERILKTLADRDAETKANADAATPAVNDLANAITNTGSATTGAASGFTTYTEAIRALKNEIPELAEQLATLDARTRIDGVYRQALQKARTMGEVMQAGTLRDAALSSLASAGARNAASGGMLDLIGFAEGTDNGRGYNETLGFGAFTGGDRTLVTMTLDHIDAMQTQMLRHPANKFNSSAAGRYQITQRTLRGLRDQLGLSGDEVFSTDLQDRLAQELLRQRGNDVAGLRNEWEGLRRIDDATIRQAYDGTSITMPAIDPGKAANIEQARQQATAYADIVANAKQYTSQMQFEQQALDMTAVKAAALRYEQDMLNQAQRAGIQVTPQQRAEIQQLAQGMATAEQATSTYASTQQQAAQTSQFFGQQAVDALSGILTGTMTAEQALQQLVSTLVRAALQAAILGEGPLAGLLGGGKGGSMGGSAKGGVGILGALLGFAEGGEVDATQQRQRGHVRGPGTGTSDSIVARLSDGEFVVRAGQTRKHRALLEAINDNRLPAFARGGLVGKDGASVFAQASSNVVSINAPVTVNAAGGTPEQNQDLAKQVSKQVEATMRGVVVSELARQMRPGNMGNRRGS